MVVQEMLKEGQRKLVVLLRGVVGLPNISFSRRGKCSQLELLGHRHLVAILPQTLETMGNTGLWLRLCQSLRIWILCRLEAGFLRRRSLRGSVLARKMRVVDVGHQLFNCPEPLVAPAPLTQLWSRILLVISAQACLHRTRMVRMRVRHPMRVWCCG